jgi:hypothetical protein
MCPSPGVGRRRFTRLGAAIVFAAALQAPALAADDGRISGELVIHGCQPGSALLVRARPEQHPREVAPPRAVTVAARRTGTPGVWRFDIAGLDPERPWRVGVQLRDGGRLTPAACGGLRWTVDREPLVMPGEAPLRFDGHALRARIELRSDPDAGPDRPEWVGADTFDPFLAEEGTRQLRWQTDVPDVDGGRLEVSLTPFPRIAEPRYDPCTRRGEPVTPIWTQDFAAVPGRWSELSVDFHALLMTRGGPGAAAEVDEATAVKLELGAPVYVRVLPLRAGRVECSTERDGTPPELVLAKVRKRPAANPPPDPVAPIRIAGSGVYSGPTYVLDRPNGKYKPCYRVLKAHTLPPSMTWMTSSYEFVAVNWGAAGWGDTLQKGQWFCSIKSSSSASWFESAVDSFGAVLSAVVDGVGEIVNFTSAAWESIQDGVVGVVADAISSVGIIDCGAGSVCRKALEAGLEIALASMGVPPSLPNFDQLVDQGFDYMAAQVASQVGAPDVLADYASAQAQKFVQQVAHDMSSSYGIAKLPDWLAPTLNFEPASITIPLRGAGKANPYLSTPLMIRKNATPYIGATLALPRMLPGETEPPMMLPMTLPPDLYGLPPAPSGSDAYTEAYHDKANWLKLRYDACYQFYLVALSTPGGVQPVADWWFNSQTALACGP